MAGFIGPSRQDGWLHDSRANDPVVASRPFSHNRRRSAPSVHASLKNQNPYATARKTKGNMNGTEMSWTTVWLSSRYNYCAVRVEPALAQTSAAARPDARPRTARNAIPPTVSGTLTIAPAFRTLHLKYRSKAKRPRQIIAGHPVPQFRLDADQVADVIAYLKTLQR
jgi:hypothetical protein